MKRLMKKPEIKQFLFGIWEIVEIVVVALATVFLIRTFLFQPFLVSGASMEPTFSDGNYIIIDEITYRFRDPIRGEVIVFRYPLDKSSFFIKRVVGLPGERIVSRDGDVKIYKGEEVLTLDETYLPENTKITENIDTTLKEDEYFVMGDNRYHSYDSRNWGAVKKEDIIGIARLRVFPIENVKIFNPPAY
ncbi:MAG: signal peptidase I [Candidatus Harrisonbacteria bacterium CG10_big_fil_rev_8_21_14_0_10_40_38]|uniref:Signal peptidase I n=1 Tax=Candidatus Harrisonbacteria bacterium CG10_big_fil_rev_8_21_14_0_10_40_38 TaxID=1974583 RepID=A0A2H0URS4_9BACT|nr:MAG: signal peptidase I [Candidatus Harrisonbacteria bacterium CG10_big_fil_rev_8_21_14_0_10_40_38]